MPDHERALSTPAAAIPEDDPRRDLAVARPDADDGKLLRVAVAGGVYTILLTAADTNGHYCLIDMRVPPGGGPPPHRHDFEEMFTVLEGEIEFTFRGRTLVARAGETVNVPANAPHSFRNTTDGPARQLCMCTPPGQEEFFLEVGGRRGECFVAAAGAERRGQGRPPGEGASPRPGVPHGVAPAAVVACRDCRAKPPPSGAAR